MGDAEGRFEVEGVAAGLALRVFARGYRRQSIEVGADEVSVTVRLARGGRPAARRRKGRSRQLAFARGFEPVIPLRFVRPR